MWLCLAFIRTDGELRVTVVEDKRALSIPVWQFDTEVAGLLAQDYFQAELGQRVRDKLVAAREGGAK